jgi:hypothetical protein
LSTVFVRDFACRVLGVAWSSTQGARILRPRGTSPKRRAGRGLS